MSNAKLVSVISLGLLAAGQAAVAQEAPTTLDEIVVTAQKREQSIQDVTASVSALSGKDLAERGLTGMRGYSDFVSGMIYSAPAVGGARSGPDITIRGIANSRLIDFETTIATATTGFVYGQMPAYSFDPRLTDISRIEVLKGPQGTLYGSASLGGTVKVVPNAPDASAFYGELTGGLGYTQDGAGNYEFSGLMNIPLIEDILAVRMSAYSYLDSGYIDSRMVTGDPNEDRGGVPDLDPINASDTDIFNTEEPTQNFIGNSNETESLGLQFAAKYSPTDKFDATLSFFFQSEEEQSGAHFEPGLAGKLQERSSELFMLEPSSTDYSITSLELRYDLGFAELYSVTGGLNRDYSNATDFSAVVYGVLGGDGTFAVPGTAPVNYRADIDVVSQELRLQGDADVMAGLNWTVGYFYQKEDRLSTGSAPLSPDWVASGLLPTNSGTRFVWAGEYTSEYTNSSVFADATLSLTDRIDFSVGVRSSDQDLDSTRIDFSNHFAGAPANGTATASTSLGETSTTPRVAFSWKANDDVMLYASASEGFRLGGANPAANLTTPQCLNALGILGLAPSDASTYESDEVVNYELGIKSQFSDNRIQFNAAIFQADWSDMQVASFLGNIDPGCGATLTLNAGSAEVKGVELDIKAILADNFQVGLVAEFNDAELTEVAPGVPAASPGDSLKSIPDFSIALGFQYDFAIPGGADAFARLDYVNVGDRSFSDIAAGPSEANELPSYDLVNFRLGANYEDWDVVAYIDNITDESPNSAVTYQSRGPGVYADGQASAERRYIGRPRTAGLRITKRF